MQSERIKNKKQRASTTRKSHKLPPILKNYSVITNKSACVQVTKPNLNKIKINKKGIKHALGIR